ncbi:MAG TPA: large conductance mechanosensitive channel protein MscL [Vicinamibacterales bacterium]|nr:large conductance mechanosensitive channel protein MscL [Vicinamibacterales bacterium]
MLQEFKNFIVKGNAFEFAVGVIIAAVFGAVMGSFVSDIFMPPIGLLLGGADFSNLFITLKEGAATAGPYASLEAAKTAGAVTVNIGVFLNTVVNLVVVGFVVFMLVRAVNSARKPAPAPAAPPTPEDIVLLREIRDALKK